jgi:glycerol-3-phosphate acyltransferase PlsX
MSGGADVVVTDGFTGNVALKTLEGGLQVLIGSILGVFDTNEETKEASARLLPYLLPLYETMNPDNVGGAMLLGVNGVCIISHGSSSAAAIVNAVKVAAEMVDRGIVEEIRAAVTAA